MNIFQPELLNMIVSNLRRKLNYSIEDESILPVCVKYDCITKLENISRQIKETTKENLR